MWTHTIEESGDHHVCVNTVEDCHTGDVVCLDCGMVLVQKICDNKSYRSQASEMPAPIPPLVHHSTLPRNTQKAAYKTYCNNVKRILEDMDLVDLQRVWFTAVEIIKEFCTSMLHPHRGVSLSDDNSIALAAVALQLAFHACNLPRSTVDMALAANVTVSSIERATKRIHSRINLSKLKKIMRA